MLDNAFGIYVLREDNPEKGFKKNDVIKKPTNRVFTDEENATMDKITKEFSDKTNALKIEALNLRKQISDAEYAKKLEKYQ